ncbi:hypothetical protein LOD99_10314 [Oopsacas minuta]|uniref:Integrase catalytic domain-containing protein n=1 Tax=Oopsacas minuta TaxID=111878 RepID=A0AAV7KHX9_9METZ|nr:hypothetical protein LOD99_10314 [Oopsacas minuta]
MAAHMCLRIPTVPSNIKIDNRSTSAYHPQSNGLVEAHNKILKRKIDKFRSNIDVEWPERIYEACLAANTHLKNAIKTTPFRLMFGRDFNPVYLFQTNNIEVEVYTDSNSEDDAVIEPETQESIFDPSIDANEWIEKQTSPK